MTSSIGAVTRMTPDEIRAEIRVHRNRLKVLKGMDGAPPVKGPPRIVVDLDKDDLASLHQLAHERRTSLSALGQRAVKQLLGQVRSDAIRIEHAVPALSPVIEAPARSRDNEGMTSEEIETEIIAHNGRMGELFDHPDHVDDPKGEGPPRIVIGLTRREFEEIEALGNRSGVSVSALGRQAVEQLLGHVRAGAIPMIVPSTMHNAIGVFDGIELPL